MLVHYKIQSPFMLTGHDVKAFPVPSSLRVERQNQISTAIWIWPVTSMVLPLSDPALPNWIVHTTAVWKVVGFPLYNPQVLKRFPCESQPV